MKLAGKSGERLAARLGIRSDEVARLRAVMVSSFVLGISLVLYYSASNAIFLTRYGIQKLPYVYIVNGFLVIAFGIGLAFLGRHASFRDAKRNRREGLRPLVRDRYTRAIFGLKTFSVLTAYLIEYIFYEQASRRFPDQQSLAGFLGTFTGLTTLVMVLISALLTGRLIASRGVRGTLFLMPLAMAATSVATTAYGALIDVGTAFFALVAVTMFLNQVLEKAVYTPTLVLLFQPMPRERRLPVRVIVEGWLGSVALILSGALLLFVTWLHPPNVVPFVTLLAVVSVAFLLQTREAVSQYARALWRATSRGFADVRAAAADGERPDDALLERLAPGTSPAEQEEARAALRTSTRRLDDNTLAGAVQVQIASARSLLAAERDLSVARPLLAACLHEELTRVRANLFSLLCCSRDAAGAAMADILLDAEARIANGAADDRANAIELLDVTLPNWLKRSVVALAEDHGPLQMLRKLGGGPIPAPLTAAERLTLMADDTSLGSWTVSLVRLGAPPAAPAGGRTESDDEKGPPMPDVGSPEVYPPEVTSVLWLRSIDIFRRVPYQLLSELSGRLRPFPVSAGVRIVTEGEEGEELYIVRSGEVAVQHGDDVLARIGPGSVFGEFAVLDPAPRSADVVATTDADLLILDRTTLLDLMGRRPEVAADIITMLVRRLRARTPGA